ncbi:MAG: pyridoxal 5'-phosphate synthase lyase subunit PdxS [Methanobacteriota archaeon]|nr:MAG: pyridoxal 5'-phosphate synthase lyase subunit PdxS [Euryarchaeota archaeon]
MPLDLDLKTLRFGTELLKRGFAKMQKGGVIMDVTNADQALIAEEAGAVAVMALERVPADIRTAGGVARMADPLKVKEIIDSVSIPVMAKARIGHFVEAQALQTLGADMIDESEVLTPGDPFYHIDKRKFDIPFVCGARNLGEAARRIFEGAAMIRTKGEAGTGNVIEAVRHQRLMTRAIEELKTLNDDETKRLATAYSKSYGNLLGEVRKASQDEFAIANNDLVFEELSLGEVTNGVYEVLLEIKEKSRLPVVNFAAGGLATPADAALMMQLGCDGVFVGSGIFKSENPKERGKAIVEATTNFDDPAVIAEVSKGLGDAMKGLEISDIPADQRLQERGW